MIFHCLLLLAQDCRGSLSLSSKFDFELPLIATKFLQVVPCWCFLANFEELRKPMCLSNSKLMDMHLTIVAITQIAWIDNHFSPLRERIIMSLHSLCWSFLWVTCHYQLSFIFVRDILEYIASFDRFINIYLIFQEKIC